MGTRYKILYREHPEVEARLVGIVDTVAYAEQAIDTFVRMNPEEIVCYSYEEFDDPEFTPKVLPTWEDRDTTVSQESLDKRLAQTPVENHSDITTKEQRITICTSCEFNKPVLGFGNCSECNCFTYLKATIKSSTCPKGKW